MNPHFLIQREAIDDFFFFFSQIPLDYSSVAYGGTTKIKLAYWDLY